MMKKIEQLGVESGLSLREWLSQKIWGQNAERGNVTADQTSAWAIATKVISKLLHHGRLLTLCDQHAVVVQK